MGRLRLRLPKHRGMTLPYEASAGTLDQWNLLRFLLNTLVGRGTLANSHIDEPT